MFTTIQERRKKRIKPDINYRSTVVLKNECCTDTGLGLILAKNNDGKAVIKEILTNSPANRCDKLQAGDIIFRIDSHQKLKYDDFIKKLKDCRFNHEICLEVLYVPYRLETNDNHIEKSIRISLDHRDVNESFGLLVRFGVPYHNNTNVADTQEDFDKPCLPPVVIVAAIRPNSVADREGSIKVGDRILAVNECTVNNPEDFYTHVLQVHSCIITIQYFIESAPLCTNDKAIIVDIEKTADSSIGISLGHGQQGILQNPHIIIKHVKPASIAERCGAIQPGDMIISVNDILLINTDNLIEVKGVLEKASRCCRIRLGIKPKFSQCLLALPEFGQAMLDTNQRINTTRNSLSLLCSNCQHVSQSMFNLPIEHPVLYSVNSMPRLLTNKIGANQLYASSDKINSPTLISTERITLLLKANRFKDLGIRLYLPYPNFYQIPSIICEITANGSAARSGVIQCGDRILKINRHPTTNFLISQLQIEEYDDDFVQLELEFNVSDSISLSTGIFNVKLYKCAQDIGISCMYSDEVDDHNYPLVVDVVKGGIAYRSGMIQAGYILMAVNNKSVKLKSLTYIFKLIESAPIGSIVTLMFKKSEDSSYIYGVSYTVEVKNPAQITYGIWLEPDDDIYAPLIVSEISESGLIYQTKAIHRKDRFLAVNDVISRGKNFDEISNMLVSQFKKSMSFRIFRPHEKKQVQQHFETNKFANNNDHRSHSYTHNIGTNYLMENSETTTSQDSALDSSCIESSSSDQLQFDANAAVIRACPIRRSKAFHYPNISYRMLQMSIKNNLNFYGSSTHKYIDKGTSNSASSLRISQQEPENKAGSDDKCDRQVIAKSPYRRNSSNDSGKNSNESYDNLSLDTGMQMKR
ncbi:hypothetical protein GJ496_001461 [Pomphorhynchus laevis]|nr:hypothetical protein GJ496_001461 [Pomphorhynchus laevis]